MTEQLLVPHGECGLCGGRTLASAKVVCVRCEDCRAFVHVTNGVECMTANDGETVRWTWMRGIAKPIVVQVDAAD